MFHVYCVLKILKECYIGLYIFSKAARATMVRDLQDALRMSRQVRVADLIARLMESPKTMEDILAPHSDREGMFR